MSSKLLSGGDNLNSSIVQPIQHATARQMTTEAGTDPLTVLEPEYRFSEDLSVCGQKRLLFDPMRFPNGFKPVPVFSAQLLNHFFKIVDGADMTLNFWMVDQTVQALLDY